MSNRHGRQHQGILNFGANGCLLLHVLGVKW
jgi:hypothetical protein